MRAIRVELGSRSYEVRVGAGILGAVGEWLKPIAGRGTPVVVTVPPVERLYLAQVEEALESCGLDPLVVVVEDGEDAKTPSAFLDVVGRMLEGGAGRDSTVISLGGGCVGDLSGFVASTYMRGVGLVHIPTTLLAQVDSSIGGKTALNHPKSKNLIGTFHQPRLVVSDVSTLKTLPRKEIRCGLAEVVKYGVVLDRRLFEYVESRAEGVLALEERDAEEVVGRSVAIKAGIVSEDESDIGRRMLLNFGHTVGHAIEAATGYRKYSHGEAVALGMVAESKIAERLGMLRGAELSRIEALLSELGLPTGGGGVPLEAALGLMRGDKKVEGGELRFALPCGIGSGKVVRVTDMGVIKDALSEVL
ncbi:MAG: 3-dehydroquinate synthase [Candidatus Verstraetearchaeota archaeon]|nr:3-dehydroquinate synthase [Candidatus Verstraetearchaeota archaeon]